MSKKYNFIQYVEELINKVIQRFRHPFEDRVYMLFWLNKKRRNTRASLHKLRIIEDMFTRLFEYIDYIIK